MVRVMEEDEYDVNERETWGILAPVSKEHETLPFQSPILTLTAIGTD